MTLAMAIRCSDGLVLATDSRATGGALGAADISEKFLQVNRDVGVMTYGLAVPGYRAIRQLVENVRARPGRYATMSAIVRRAKDVCTQTFRSFVARRPQLQGEAVGFIVAGFDGNETGLFRIFHMESTTDFEPSEELQMLAARWHLPSVLMRYLSFPGMSVKTGADLAVLLMILTSTFDEAVGGPIRLATVTIDRGFMLMHEAQVQALIQGNQNRLAQLKMAWTEAWIAA